MSLFMPLLALALPPLRAVSHASVTVRTQGAMLLAPPSTVNTVGSGYQGRPLDDLDVGRIEDAQPALVTIRQKIAERRAQRQKIRRIMQTATAEQISALKANYQQHENALADLHDARLRLVRKARAALWRQSRAAARKVREW